MRTEAEKQKLDSLRINARRDVFITDAITQINANEQPMPEDWIEATKIGWLMVKKAIFAQYYDLTRNGDELAKSEAQTVIDRLRAYREHGILSVDLIIRQEEATILTSYIAELQGYDYEAKHLGLNQRRYD